MKYNQIDQITLLVPGERIEALRALTGDEYYLRDHFPRFAVMPGVMMLESLYQAAALLVRASEGFQTGLVLLREAKNVKFADFVKPGQTLSITAEIIKQEGPRFVLKASGHREDSLAVSARLVVELVPGANGQPKIVEQMAAKYMKQLTRQLQSAAMASS